MIPQTSDSRWTCEATIGDHRCPDPATEGGFCPAHHAHPPRRWRLLAVDGDGRTVHDSRVTTDRNLNDAIHALESRPDWTRDHRIRVAPA